jgi:hypothetical protein
MNITRITADGKYLAQCRQCGTWVELYPETTKGDIFFEVHKADFHCCGLPQTATFFLEKDTVDFH